jgi:ATP-dependent RNA helicase DeaD
MRETLIEIGYSHPTPVQIAVWDPATRGKDAVVQARTGTGKTAAFGLPIVDHLVRRSQPRVQALVLCPTRELANQVATELERLGRRKNVRVVPIYGGAAMQRQIDQIAEGAQVVVGTPGRVLDHLRRGTLDPRHVRLLVLDESDEMLSMGFEREVTAILDALPKDRQTLLFSATVPPDIERMAKKLRNPELITLSGDHIGALEIAHFVYLIASDKSGALVRIIEVENPESAIIFCNTRDETERVAQVLARQGFDADWLNGDLPQESREKVMSATREGRLRFLVATDVAARGIDISHLTHVINYDFPQDAESYVHRTGRTGRAGRTGTAISLIMPQDIGGLYLLRLTFKIRPIEKQIPTEGELKTRAQTDVVAMLAEAFTSRGVHADDLMLARRLLTHEERDVIVAGLLRDHLGARPTASDDAATARRASRAILTNPSDAKPPPGATDASVSRAGAAPSRGAPAVDAQASAATEPVGRSTAGITVETPPGVLRASSISSPTLSSTAASEAPIQVTPSTTQPVAAQRVAFQAVAPRAAVSTSPEPAIATERIRPARSEGRDTGELRDVHEPDERRPRPRAGYEFRRAPMDRRGRPEPRSRDDLGDTDTLAVRGAAPSSRSVGEASAPSKHSDFVTWQPPEEEGDDEPILGHDDAPGARARQPDRPRPEPEHAPAQEVDLDFVEVYVNVGRREGARAIDIQRLLTERAGLDRSNVRRIRVRERNAFVSVCRQDMARAVSALTGASIGGKLLAAEQARERLLSEGDPGGEPGSAGMQNVVAGGELVDCAALAAVEAPAPAGAPAAGGALAAVAKPTDERAHGAAPEPELGTDETAPTSGGSGAAPGT